MPSDYTRKDTGKVTAVPDKESPMLILTRRPGDIVIIEPHSNATGTDASAYFSQPIEVRILRVEGKHVRIGIEAAEGLRIWRGERGNGEGRMV